jgi:glutathione S-transferase
MSHTDTSLRVAKVIPARREDVFAAFTQKDRAQAYCPEGMEIIAGSIDARVGGRFRVTMKKGDDTHTAYGIYRGVIPNERLVFTHQWEGPGVVETIVTIDFKDVDGGTEVTIAQEGFKDSEEAMGHEEGWLSTLKNQAKHLR